MTIFWRLPKPLLLTFLCQSFLRPKFSLASNTPFLPQSFLFDWNIEGQPVPIPVSEQCETLHIKWSRGAVTGPNPTAPYYLQIYTSIYVFPFTVFAGSDLNFDWQVPFAPGTQYQICMFDKNGNTGGCQAVYTVIPAQNVTSTPSCNSLAFPLGPLDIDAEVNNGPLSQFGWVDQCTDIQVTPKNGTAPYTFTIAPALHPPWNITIDGDKVKSANWTVALSWASPFFISVSDSAGNSWANGPLHSGGGGPTNCLAAGAASRSKSKPAIPVGAGIGGLVVGALGGIGAAYFFLKKRQEKELRDHIYMNVPYHPGSPPHGAQFGRQLSRASNGPLMSTTPGFDSSFGQISNNSNGILLSNTPQYQIEPFTMPDEEGRTRSPSTIHPPSLPGTSTANELPGGAAGPSNHVYVIHHDSGRPPVTVYHEHGTEVVELPPMYAQGSRPTPTRSRSGSRSRSDPSEYGGTEVTDTTTTRMHIHGARRPSVVRKVRNPGSPR